MKDKGINNIRFFKGYRSYWLGIEQNFTMDAWIIGLVFVYIRIPQEKLWRMKHR